MVQSKGGQLCGITEIGLYELGIHGQTRLRLVRLLFPCVGYSLLIVLCVPYCVNSGPDSGLNDGKVVSLRLSEEQGAGMQCQLPGHALDCCFPRLRTGHPWPCYWRIREND